MTAPLCFLDTETTSLDAETGELWEVAVIFRDEDGEAAYRWLLPVILDAADPTSLEISGFHHRHPQGDSWGTDPAGDLVTNVGQWAEDFATLTAGFHLVGNVVSFDEERLRRLLRRHGVQPTWHYHLIDVECLAVGYLAGMATVVGEYGIPTDDPDGYGAGVVRAAGVAGLPWKSDDLSAALGVTAPTEDRHTALGDARWAQALYDAVI